MSRRRYLVTYDIADDKRRNWVFRNLEDHGDRVQYSVFVCELNSLELTRLKGLLDRCIHHREDQVLFLDLGLAERQAGETISSLGKAYEVPVRALVI